ncbi:pollen-specific leucine-rich repeat extensin-like protein 2 [Tanacetum coccineum]
MEQFTSSNCSSYSSHQDKNPPIATESSYHDSLHSVRQPLPTYKTKKFIAPFPPTPPKVYTVDSSNFKEVVRMLTSTPEFQYPSINHHQNGTPHEPHNVLISPNQPMFFQHVHGRKGAGFSLPLSSDTLNVLDETFHDRIHRDFGGVAQFFSAPPEMK